MTTRPSSFYALLGAIIAVAFSLFQLYTSAAGVLTAILQRSTHLVFASTLAALGWVSVAEPKVKPVTKAAKATSFAVIGSAIAAYVYIVLNFQEMVLRTGAETVGDIIAGALVLFVVLESTRRTSGPILPAIASAALLYSLFGRYMPGLLSHRGVSLKRLITHMALTTEGVFGVPIGVSATYVFLFVLFGAFLRESGGGEFFVNLAYALFGRVRGGPAKVAIVASGFFGSISGSAVANVVGTGTFTIPLMMKAGYKNTFAGAVEAAASTGGQFMPPIMGAAAFIMAEILGLPYINIAIAAAVPAVIYFLAIYFSVDAEAAKSGLRGLSRTELPSVRQVLSEGWPLLIPLFGLIVMLAFLKWSPMKSGFASIVICILVSYIAKASNRMTVRRILKALESGANAAVEVALVCACAGIVVGMFTLTGLGMKMSYLLVTVSRGNLLMLLVLTMICSLILGMGIPTTACYIVLAITIAPALTRLGVIPLAAHLFVFYFGISSAITPPVALAAYAAAGISGADPMATGFIAWKLALPAFLIPFAFVYGPQLLLSGSVVRITLAALSAAAGAYALSGVAIGYLLGHLRWYERAILLVAAASLIFAELSSDILGYCLLAAVCLPRIVRNLKIDRRKTALTRRN